MKMKNVFMWLQMGFCIYNRNNELVDDLRDIEPYLDSKLLPEIFMNGYYFFNKTHQVKVSNMEEYNTYFGGNDERSN